MPGSSEKGKQFIVNWFTSNCPLQSVLDVGPGWGTYSQLLRPLAEAWHAVEIHAPYVEAFGLMSLYDKVFISDIRSFELNQYYDVVICGDVLEHINNNEACEVLVKLLSHSKHVIVSLPLDAETGAGAGTGDVDWGNPHELHIGKWTHSMFINQVAELGFSIELTERHPEIAVYIIKGLICETLSL